MNNRPQKFHTTPGTVKPSSPKAIGAISESRNSFTRLIITGIVLVLLVGCYYFKTENTSEILGVIGVGLGLLYGEKK